jgi:putative transposase
MVKFKNKYRTESARMQTWDYGWPGSYFVTIVTYDRKLFFGNVIDKQMVHNKIGEYAINEWLKGPEIRPDMNLSLGEFVVMPNHFHGIITIGENEFNKTSKLMSNEETIASKKFSSPKKNLSSIIRGFKSSVTTFAHQSCPHFKWQERFHDHIIRGHDEYLRISEYIKNNPANWTGENDDPGLIFPE